MLPVEIAALIPIKAFHHAKARLASALQPDARDRLARWSAAHVLAAAAGLHVVVVCDDDSVAAWAADHGATVLWQAGMGLNKAVDDAVATLAGEGCDHVIVAHADLARPDHLRSVAQRDTITLVPDRRDDGTNVMSFPTTAPLRASYGPGSFRRHLADALASGRPVEVRRDPLLALDIDTPTDLLHPLIRPLVQPIVGPSSKDIPPSWLPTNPANRIPLT